MWPFGKNTADRVKDALNDQRHLKDAGIQVQERGGTVKLTGMVPTAKHVTLARVVAEGINGVKSVDVSGLIAQQAGAAVQTSAPQARPQPQAGASAAAGAASVPGATPPQTPAPAQAPAPASGAAAQPAQSAQPKPAPAKPQAASDQDDDLDAAEERSRIAKAVHAALRGNGELKDDPIDVLQSGKSVILRGVVDNDHELRLAEKLARGVDGVAAVDVSGLRVAAGAKELARDRDEDSGDTVYTVKAGDSLSEIAQKYYGDPMEYKKLASYNKISNPDLIQPGQKIRIPG